MNAVNISLVTALCAVLAGCATSAAEVKVPTMSMQKAWEVANSVNLDTAANPQGRVVNALIRPKQPLPVVTAPDIRMAVYVQAPDDEGNMHYEHWVAIPVDTYRWVLPEGMAVPMDGAQAKQTPRSK